MEFMVKPPVLLRRRSTLCPHEIFACRHCYRLAYTCQREPNYSWAINRAQAIREKLGGTGNLFMPFPQKPKGMHWRTYHRLRLAHEQADARSWPPFLKRFNGTKPVDAF